MNQKQLWKVAMFLLLSCGFGDAPGAGTGSGQRTFGQGITASGTT